ncbi:hypothetical protein ZIOFF_013522 [Zingiber officinale]|uniref:RING-type domain-containing protein n=1 Tax=Zingiber officinale TaxID=94328 RepID=A0A8J5HZN4_ZINOF|nr:hypothetical protein ZIOFF_013522 [Zingiber officinale]
MFPQVAQVCSNCGINMGEYFCEICKFHDDDVTLRKGSFIARTVESAELVVERTSSIARNVVCYYLLLPKFLLFSFVFHYVAISKYYVLLLTDPATLIVCSISIRVWRTQCDTTYLFDSLKETTVLQCGHTMHSDCLNEMLKHEKYCCPICSKSIMDMSSIWKKLDEEIEATDMLGNYRSRKVSAVSTNYS